MWPIILRCVGTAGLTASRQARSLSDELQKRQGSSLHRQAGASCVTEWVLERQVEKCQVTVKVNKIKAGNLRASVLHKRCRRRQGGSVKDRAGCEDYRARRSMCVDVCVFVCVFGGGILTYFASNTLWQSDEGPFLWECVCSPHTLLGRRCSTNWLKAAEVWRSADAIIWSEVMNKLLCPDLSIWSEINLIQT